MYVLQSRWKLDGNVLRYYGLRNRPNLFINTVKINQKQKKIIQELPRELNETELKILGRLIDNQVVVADKKRYIPKSLDEARFCTSCVANDFIIPGIEFDESGRCPICQSTEKTKKLKSLVPIKNTFSKAKRSRFDVAVFYTGGKDSTYLLYYLSKVCKLRVLALTWEIPYMSDSARESIENAKKHSIR